MSRPSAAVPCPSGSPVPSGGMVMSMARISSGLGVRPMPYLGDCAVRITHVTSRTAPLTIHIGHAPVGHHLVLADAIVVVVGISAANRHKRSQIRLDVACLVSGARFDDRFAAFPPPGQAKARESPVEPRLLVPRSATW